MKDGGERKLLIITSEDVAEQVVENMKKIITQDIL